ncbi:MAG: zinc ribbon domain-containing protein [Victivallales bacterium]|nr:zinc ribbon domain-containing protein [Victivallales bacterium]
MNKRLVVHVLVMVVSVGVSYWLGSGLLETQTGIAKSRSELSKAPMGGFNKFASDVQWMLFINYCGSINSVNEENVDEVYSRLDTILRNDPDFEKAYNIGAMMLAVQAPVRAAEILQRGANNPNLSSSWQIPFLAGYVLAHNVKESDDPQHLKKAEEMFRLAVRRSSPPERHVVSSLLRTKAKRIEKRGDAFGVKIANDKHAYLCAWYDEWRSSRATDELGGGGGPGTQIIGDVDARVLAAAQDAKNSAPDNKDVLKTVDTVISKVLANQHLCPSCLSRYNPGEKFCSHCGSEVAIYGTCKKCGAVLKGRFCTDCGHDSKNE